LTKCTLFIKKKFKRGQPCGDVVRAILEGKDGHKKTRPRIVKKLEAIDFFADYLQPSEAALNVFFKPRRMCRHCSNGERTAEFQMALKACSRCKLTFYCSRECQIADWKRHKSKCTTTTKTEEKRANATQQILLNFGNRHYAKIMKKVVEVCDETGLSKSDLLLELDFKPDVDAISPAFRDEPKFKVQRARGYFEGSRPNEPDWFNKSVDKVVYEKNIKNIIPSVKDQFERMTDDHVLYLVCYPEGAACYRLQQSTEARNGVEMFSEIALDAFRSAIFDEDFGKLSKIFDESQMREIGETLGAMPCEADMDKVRMLLNRMGGDFPIRG
jgi:hypothetical protein